MNKIILMSTVFLTVLTIYPKAQTYSPVYTPNGTEVPAWITSELSEDDRDYWDTYFALSYPNAIQLETYGADYSSTGRFNCHGYAWYMSENSNELANPKWIGLGYNEPSDPEYNYWQDCSYIEVSSSSIFPGKVNWSNGDHSAITTNVQGELISKWRFYPFMQHQWNDSPYGSSGLKYYIRPAITGETTLCYSGSSYSIEYLPSAATVTWSSSNDISRISAQGSNPCTFQGVSGVLSFKSYINATISFNGNTFTIEKEIQVGTKTPSIQVLDASTHSAMSSGVLGNSYYCVAIGNNLSNNSNDYRWGITFPADPITGRVTSILGKNFTPPYSGNYIIKLQYRGECGWSSTATKSFAVLGGNYFRIYPNPTSNNSVTIEQKVDSKTMLKSVDNIEITLYNNIMNPILQKKVEGKEYRLNTASLKKGIYYVQVKMNNINEIHKLTIK